jgi:hypothetical protein
LNLRWFLARHGLPGVTPIFVYQMAKVGSSSIVQALKRRGLAVFHLHMNRDHLERMRAGPRHWLAPPPLPHTTSSTEAPRARERGRRVKVITLARSDRAQCLVYFEHLDAIWNRVVRTLPFPEELHRAFIERFPPTKR